MKKTIIFKTAVSVLLITAAICYCGAQENRSGNTAYPESCTSIMVGKLASTDGSVITCHACDGNYRTWLQIVPSKDHEEGSIREVYWGKLHTETAWDMRRLELKGDIPEASHTYAYMDVAYPCLNEKQLAIGETTIYGRRELRNEEGLFLIENLQAIALQRCSTAREAVQLMGSLAEKYGYGDYAECLTVADPKEVWHFEISGAGKEEIGALWAAQRIPDDHVGVSANIPRIAAIDFNDREFFMTSTDLKKKARKLGYWDGKEPFKFYKVLTDRKPFSIRDYFILSTMAPSLNLDYEAEELPFSVKPDEKVSVQRVMAYYRETYEGTEWDMTKNLKVSVTRRDEDGNEYEEVITSPIAHNWMSRDMRNLLNELKPETVTRWRTIAIAGCSYSQVIQCRDWLPDEVGAIAWFSFDNPGQSPRIPVFSGTMHLPESFKICGQHRYRKDAALWSFREANRLSTVRWQEGRELIEPAVQMFEEKALREIPRLEDQVQKLVREGKNEEARKLVTEYTNNFAFATMKKWEAMGRKLWHRFGRGF